MSTIYDHTAVRQVVLIIHIMTACTNYSQVMSTAVHIHCTTWKLTTSFSKLIFVGLFILYKNANYVMVENQLFVSTDMFSVLCKNVKYQDILTSDHCFHRNVLLCSFIHFCVWFFFTFFFFTCHDNVPPTCFTWITFS